VPNHQELEEAIIALEAQRAVLGPEVVDISLAALRQKLRALQSSPVTEQYGSIVVLVADLSGFTVMSESMDAEELRDTINAIWERLDAVVEAWGGEIDKHVGDGLIALFGVSGAQPDDCERANSKCGLASTVAPFILAR
jgi:class 3 adenylate cyclase